MRIDYGLIPRDIVDTIHETWRRLPRDVQQQLDGVHFTYREPGKFGSKYEAALGAGRPFKAYASAGDHDIDIRELPILTDAAVGVLAHECAHVALRHATRLTAGQISEQEAEREADQLACRWGFAREIQCRKHFINM